MDSFTSNRQRTVVAKHLVLARAEGSTMIRAYEKSGGSGAADLTAAEIHAAVDEVAKPLPAQAEESIEGEVD